MGSDDKPKLRVSAHRADTTGARKVKVGPDASARRDGPSACAARSTGTAGTLGSKAQESPSASTSVSSSASGMVIKPANSALVGDGCVARMSSRAGSAGQAGASCGEEGAACCADGAAGCSEGAAGSGASSGEGAAGCGEDAAVSATCSEDASA